MISFTHNVHNRHRTLKETIQIEKQLFPESNIYVGYNDDTFDIDFFNDIKGVKFKYYNGFTHKIGCVNGCITSIKEAIKDECEVIVFSHDDVSINNSIIFNQNIENIINHKYDIICRKPDSYGNNYYMMECFFISHKKAVEIFSNLELVDDENDLPKDVKNSISPEVWLYNILNSNDSKIYDPIYKHTIVDYNRTLSNILGMYHKNIGLRGWIDNN